ncbi:hypothetical protein [Flavobacterium sp. 3HN19-14]|uniref:hypothetical protein n=1 Tax=Flavobacterium sp. 3HN19-14 TaxID=3448133 RepID=UPI003EDEEF18
MGAVNVSEKNVSRFFDSFTATPYNYKSTVKTFNDTLAKFKVDIPETQNENILLGLSDAVPYDKKPEKNAFVSQFRTYAFGSESGQSIGLTYTKYSKYENAVNLDSIKANFKRQLLKQDDFFNETNDYDYDYDAYEVAGAVSVEGPNIYSRKGFTYSKWDELVENKDKYEVVSESESFNKDKNLHVFDMMVSKPASTQAIKSRIFFTGNSYYTLMALVDKNYKNDDPFIEKTFNSFEPTEKSTASVFDDKIDIFIEDANSAKDTIRYSALEPLSIDQLKVEKKDFGKIQNFINTFKFRDSETASLKSLVEKIGEIRDDERLTPFLEALYRKEDTKTTIQISILRALANQNSKNAYKKILELLEYDLPLPDDSYEINSMFYYFQNDLESSKELFPKIFQFYSIPEYNAPIIDLCNILLERHYVSAKKLNSFKKILNTNAKLEYKRLVSWKQKNSQQSEDEPAYGYNDKAPAENLINYINLLQHFPDDKGVSELLEKAERLDIPELDIELTRLGIVYGKYNDEEIREALNDPKIKFAVINLLLTNGKGDFVKNIPDDEIAFSAVRNFRNIAEKDSLELLQKK